MAHPIQLSNINRSFRQPLIRPNSVTESYVAVREYYAITYSSHIIGLDIIYSIGGFIMQSIRKLSLLTLILAFAVVPAFYHADAQSKGQIDNTLAATPDPLSGALVLGDGQVATPLVPPANPCICSIMASTLGAPDQGKRIKNESTTVGGITYFALLNASGCERAQAGPGCYTDSCSGDVVHADGTTTTKYNGTCRNI